jgi:predicted phage-related endonuclease
MVRELSMSKTKEEMLDAYHALLKQLQEKREAELKPEKEIEEKKKREVVTELLTFQDNWRNPIKRFRISPLSPLRDIKL